MNVETKTATERAIAVELPPDNLPAVVSARQERKPRLPKTIAPPSVYSGKIAKSVIAITREIGRIQKEGFNKFQQYKYTKWEDINEKLSPLLVDHGLVIVQNEISRDLLEKGEKGSVLAIVYHFTLVNEDGDAWPPVEWTAIARLTDAKGTTDDKAASKCHTQAEKQFCIKQFKIRTEEFVEGDATLNVKESRERFFALERELNAAKDIDGIKKWGADNRNRIEVLAPQFQEKLRARFRARLADPAADAIHPAEEWGEAQGQRLLNALHAHHPETGEIAGQVVWEDDGERPANSQDLTSPPPPAAMQPAPSGPSNPSKPPEGAGTLSIEAMAREAAMRGRSVFDGFYKARNAADKATLRLMKAELEALMPAEVQ